MEKYYKIKPIKIEKEYQSEIRFMIVDENDNILDDAQGYYYKTKEKATKAAWWKFKDGKNVQSILNKEIKLLLIENPTLKNFINDIYEINMKDICNGIILDDEIIKSVFDNFGIEISKKQLKTILNWKK